MLFYAHLVSILLTFHQADLNVNNITRDTNNITITGRAFVSKFHAAVRTYDGTVYYLHKKGEWGLKYEGKMVKVRAELMNWLPEILKIPGSNITPQPPLRDGIYLKNAKWKLVNPALAKEERKKKDLPDQFLVVLGVAQDGGYPQAGCKKECCGAYWNGRESKKYVTSLALVDRGTETYWLFEASPDITQQLHDLQPYLRGKDYGPSGIFITHAHMGHYAGLMQFGREAMGARNITVYAMPRLDSFLRNNGPWNQLVNLHNIYLEQTHADSSIDVLSSLKITPIRVPHRDEYSETVGFLIESAKKKVLFIPDIDKWEKWNKDIIAMIGKVDIALLDGTFYNKNELPGRDMKEIPHPFVEESMQRFSELSSADKAKIIFIHFNHTNPMLGTSSKEKANVKKQGFGVAEQGLVIGL